MACVSVVFLHQNPNVERFRISVRVSYDYWVHLEACKSPVGFAKKLSPLEAPDERCRWAAVALALSL